MPHFHSFKLNGVKGVSIYEYDDNIKSLLYQFKGCYDYELFPIFISPFSKELSLRYCGYVMVPAPSFELEDEKRGFNHVVAMFGIINLQMYKCIYKNAKFKQAENNSHKRSDISKFLSIKNKEELTGKKVLIVDDVMTTGSTLYSMVELIRSASPKDIKILVMAERILHLT